MEDGIKPMDIYCMSIVVNGISNIKEMCIYKLFLKSQIITFFFSCYIMKNNHTTPLQPLNSFSLYKDIEPHNAILPFLFIRGITASNWEPPT